MIDLFGIKKDGETHEETPATPSRGRNKLWGVLLVIDSIFVIVFGGAVAAKLYHYWKAPASAPRVSERARAKTPTPAAPGVEARAPEPAKPEPPRVEARPAEKAPAPPKTEGPKNARPSLVAEAPKGRQAPKPQPAAPEKPAAAKPEEAAPARGDAKTAKAQPVDFRFRSSRAKHVQLAGAFIVRGGGRKDMVHQSDGVWTLTLYLKPDTFRYHFIVDGKKALDPDNPKVERGSSVLTIAP